MWRARGNETGFLTDSVVVVGRREDLAERDTEEAAVLLEAGVGVVVEEG